MRNRAVTDKLTRPNLMKPNLVTFGSFFILNTIWILAQSAFNSVLFGRQTSPLISEPLCLEVVPPPLHSAHCLQGGLRHPTFSFRTHFPPGGHFPASLLSKQLLAPQSIPVQWRSPSKHRHLLQSSCTVELWSWIVPSLSLQFLVSFSSSTTKVFFYVKALEWHASVKQYTKTCKQNQICHLRNEKWTGAKMCPAVVSGIAFGGTHVITVPEVFASSILFSSRF